MLFVLEKWKDARISRTMVSQVSSPDQPPSSFSSVTTSQPITMQELTIPSPITKTETQSNNNHLECPYPDRITMSPPVPVSLPPFSPLRGTPIRLSGTRSILAEEDVIVEEEEFPETPNLTAPMDNLKRHIKDENFSNGIPDSNKIYDKQFKFDNVKITHNNK